MEQRRSLNGGADYVEVTIGVVEGTYVRLRSDVAHQGRPWFAFSAELHGIGLDASVGVLEYGSTQDLGSFLSDLAESWRGWEGTKTYNSLEYDLTVEARREGGHNVLRFTVRAGTSQSWTATLVVMLEAGEEMANVAREVSDLIARCRS